MLLYTAHGFCPVSMSELHQASCRLPAAPDGNVPNGQLSKLPCSSPLGISCRLMIADRGLRIFPEYAQEYLWAFDLHLQ